MWKITVNQHVCIIRTIEDELNPNFLNYFLLSKKGQKQIDSFQAGGNRQGLNFGQIKSFQIPLPPLHEQQAIASALSDVDALIAALEQLITKKRNIKQGAMQQLLTGKKRLPGFSGEWEVKKLGEYSEFHKGKGLPKSEITTNGKYKCIHYGELFTTYNEEIKEVFSRTDKKDNFFLSRANDVLMPTSDVTPNGLATASCIKENEVILGGDVLVIRALADVLDGLFLSYSITQNKKQIMQLVSGSTVYHLYGSDMKKYQFNIPPTKEEQQAIAQILSDMDTGIESLEQKRDKYKAIKQGMMQELLTGKRRLA
jgi:type I restriction enzyme S subunit